MVWGHIHRDPLIEFDGPIYANDGKRAGSLAALSGKRDMNLCPLLHAGKVLVDIAPQCGFDDGRVAHAHLRLVA